MAVQRLLEETFTGAGIGVKSAANMGEFNVSISGTFIATIQLQRAFQEAPTTWLPVLQIDENSTVEEKQQRGLEVEENVIYRFEVTSYTSGTINVRLSK